MRVLRGSFLARRMGSAWLLLTCLMASVAITSALISALVNFYSSVLPGSVRHELATSGGLSLAVSGGTTDSLAASQSAAVTTWMHRALRPASYRLYRDVWSDELNVPVPSIGGNTAVLQAATMQDVRAFSVLTAGAWPTGPQPGKPVPVALPVGTASQLKVRIGSVLHLSDRSTGKVVQLQVTGLFQRRQSASLYWDADPIGPSGLTVRNGFASYGPALVSPAAFTGAGGNPPVAEGALSFVALPSAASVASADLPGLAHQLSTAIAGLPNNSALAAMTASTTLPGVLAVAARQLAAARMLVIISALQLLLLAAAALALAGRLLAGHRDEECALLTARGAARWQLIRPSVAEAILACAAAAAVGTVAGGWLAELLQSGAQRTSLGPAVSSLAAWLAVVVVFAFCLVIVVWPAMRPSGIADVRLRRGRQALVANATAAGADIALIVLALLSVRELRGYSAASAVATAGIDPVIAVAPAVALAGLAVIALRLLPLAARGLEWLTARGRRLGTAMANWEISRRPVRQSGPVLLVILAVGAGTLALAQYESWSRSVTDQANFAVGADVRVDLEQPLPPSAAGRISRLPGVTAAMAVSETGYTGGTGVVMGVTSAHAADAVLLRSDLSALPASRLWRELKPSALTGLTIPGRPAVLAIKASVAPGAAGTALGPVSATVTVQDASGATYLLPAGSIAADGKPHELTAQIAPAANASYPLRFLGLSLTYNWPSPSRLTSPAALTIFGLAESGTPTGPAGRPFATGAALAGFHATVSASDLAYLVSQQAATDALAPVELSWHHVGSAQRLAFDPGNGPKLPAWLVRKFALENLTAGITVLAPDQVTTLPAVATRGFLSANNLHVGSRTSVSVGNTLIGLHIVAAVSEFPTAPSGGVLIVDQAAIQDILASSDAAPLPVTGWWLRTDDGAAPAGLHSGLPPGSAVSTAAQQAIFIRSQPLSAAPVRGAVAMSAAAALLAAFGFCVNVAASARARRSQRALLAALGVPPAAQARLFCLEELMLSAPAAAVGLGIGVLLSHLLIPAMAVSSTAGKPIPSVIVTVPFAWVIPLAIVVPAIPILAAAVSAVRQPDPAAELRAAEAA
jgi:hypothetical protein